MSNYQGFGGVGASGYGRHGGYEGFKNFSNRKGMLMKKPTPAWIMKMQMPPLSEDKKKSLGGMVKGSITMNQEDLYSFGSGFFMFLVLLIKGYFFYIYAMANPDKGSCFVNSEGVIATTRAETKAMEGEVFEVSKLF